MSREFHHLKALFLLGLVLFWLTSQLSSTYGPPLFEASADYTGVAKPMSFYFHYLDAPVKTAGLETKYIMNTTRQFGFLTQREAHQNSFYKPIGLPKVVVTFYLYPNLAGPATIDGLWQVFVWVNGSAYKPVGFTMQFREITSGGPVLWDSGPINPTITSSVGPYIDVPIYSYNLSTTLVHSFNADTTLEISIEVNAGSSADTRFWYDSPLCPSKAILPAKDYARPATVKTYAYDGNEVDLFYYNWSENQRIVTIRANVTDPFGGYDIHDVNMTLIDPTGSTAVENVEMAHKSGDQELTGFSYVFEANWTYLSTVQRGNFTAEISVADNNGYYHYLDYGSFAPFIEDNIHTFTVGILVFYDPAIRVVDDLEEPLPYAEVFITWPNGTRDVLPRYTTANGYINLTHVLSANYGFLVLWKDVVVMQATIYVDSNGPYTVKCEAYRLLVNVLGNNRAPVQGAYVIVYSKTGTAYGLDVTNATGYAMFTLPKGVYRMETLYSGEYWLRVTTAKASEQDVSVDTSTSRTLILADFPPPIWSTTGFLMVVILIALAAAATGFFLLRRRKWNS